MATHFERQLEELHVQIITMGSLCEKVISLSNRAIRGDKCIQEIFDTDKEIDAKEREIENLCMRILLHQQPVARDLRRISAALKMITDMERIGDQTSDIAEIIISSKWEKMDENLDKLTAMATGVSKMVRNSVTAYVEKDLELARTVMKDDDEIDDYFDEIRYVPLETRDDCLVGSSPDIKLLDKYILITSANRQCLLFDKATGKFKCQIGHVGKDPGGYRNVDCLVDELNGRLLFNGWGHDLISYNLDGNYIGKIELLIFLRKYS